MTADASSPVDVLSRALDQAAQVLGDVRPEHRELPTPCREWTVGRLVDHLVAAPGHFVTMMRGGEPDWAAEPEHLDAGWAEAFRSAAGELARAWQERDDAASAGADWQTAEFAVHTWDLARGIERPTGDLDPEVARRGLAFMRANLTADNRGAAFGPEREAPAGATAYDQLAAFAGREA